MPDLPQEAFGVFTPPAMAVVVAHLARTVLLCPVRS
jgi:hypothetical protein